MGYYIYLLFIVSWFTHLASRITLLGFVRFDLVLVVLLFFIALKEGFFNNLSNAKKTGSILLVLSGYIAITTPFVEWPGTVVRYGVENFIKAIVFFLFTVQFVTTEWKLRVFLAVFLASMTFRVMEPLYLHITEGYWGDVAFYSMGTEFMYRLSGAPHDIINPNGLAFVILTILPFYYYLFFTSWKYKIAVLIMTPFLLYALMLTGSRSGVIGLLIVVAGIVLKSQNKAMVIAIALICGITMFSCLNPELRDRYLSIFSRESKQAETASGRIEGVKESFRVAMRKPIVGHGLGTSIEANFNFTGKALRAHNLYAEIAQEIGFLGLIIFINYMRAIVSNFYESYKRLKNRRYNCPFLFLVSEAMLLWMVMNFVFSFASYGLSSYEWYLFGGLSVVLLNLTAKLDAKESCRAHLS